MIGSLGRIVFETSSDIVRTFDDFKIESKIRTAKHDVHEIKPVKELIGPDLDRISFTMYLNVTLGVNPKKEIQELRSLMEKGEALKLIIGGEVVGSGYYTIENINETWKNVDNRGILLAASIDIELEEYVEAVNKTYIKALKNTSKDSKKVKKKNVKKVSKLEKSKKSSMYTRHIKKQMLLF